MMQKKILVLAVITATTLLVACKHKDGAGSTNLTTDSQKFSYIIGVQLGGKFKEIKSHVDMAALQSGMNDGMAGKPSQLDQATTMAVMQSMSKTIMAEQSAAAATAASARTIEGSKALTDGAKFLADNAKKPGVKTTASGLEYEVITEGTGPHPKATDLVTVNYKGSLLNGQVFDSSYDRHQPATFPLDHVIPGWTEGVQLMTVGSKYKLYIPSSLGYGPSGAGDKIGPNETLVFEVELISIGGKSQ